MSLGKIIEKIRRKTNCDEVYVNFIFDEDGKVKNKFISAKQLGSQLSKIQLRRGDYDCLKVDKENENDSDIVYVQFTLD